MISLLLCRWEIETCKNWFIKRLDNVRCTTEGKTQRKLTLRELVLCHGEWSFGNFKFCICFVTGKQVWRSGDSTRLPALWPGFDSRRLMWVASVLGSLLALRVVLHVFRFSSLNKKSTLSNSNSTRKLWTTSRPVDMPLLKPIYLLHNALIW